MFVEEILWLFITSYLESVQKWDCIVQNSATADPLLVDCRNSFLNASLHDPDNICSQVETLMLCYRAPFYISCGEDVHFSYFLFQLVFYNKKL